MSIRSILFILILYNFCSYGMNDSVIKKYLSQEHVNQTRHTDIIQNNDTEIEMDQLCSMTYEQYYQRLTLKNYKNYKFKAKTEDQVRVIASYFDLSYFKDMNKIVSRIDVDLDNDTSVNLIQSYETQDIVLFNNDTNADQVILGVLAPFDSENDAIRMQAFYKVNTSSFKMNELWFLNFIINDDNATCYFCNDNNPFSGKNCTIRGEFNRIGELVNVNISSYSIKSGELRVKTSEICLIRANISSFISLQSLLLFLHTCLKHLIFVASFIWMYKHTPKYISIYSSVCFESIILVLLLIYLETLIDINIEAFPKMFWSRILSPLTWLILDIVCNVTYLFIYSIKLYIEVDKDVMKRQYSKIRLFPIGAVIVLYIYMLLSLLGYLKYSIFDKIWMHPNICLILLSNIYLFPIVANIAFRARCALIHPICIILISVYFVCHPFTIYGYSEIIDGFDYLWITKFMVCSTIHAIILYIQMHYGSRFFLFKWRERTYDKLTFSLFELTEYRFKYCDVCLNDLDDEEMEYLDLDNNYNYRTYQRHMFIKLVCGHVFHPNCLFRRIKYHQKCPQCDVELPEDDYLD